MTFDKDLFKGKVAVVTGGGTGIGRGIALALARHGADVALAARSVDRLEAVAGEIRALGRRSLAVACDVAEHEQVKAAAERIEAELGPVSLLVNNAAANFIWPSEKLTAVRWRKVIDIVLNGTFHGCLEFGKRMLERGGGSIVNIVASYAWQGAPGLAPSASAKAGVVTLTQTLGAEWAPRGVRVNAVSPGPIDVPQTRERLWPTSEMRDKLLKQVPAGRFGLEEDVANAVLYLASPAASYVTGDVLVVDGGQCLGRGALDFLDDLAVIRKGRKQGAGRS